MIEPFYVTIDKSVCCFMTKTLTLWYKIIRKMTLQQLRYIIAVDKYRNFAKAADSCNVSQPTLSAMLVKLEEELDVRIFERNSKSVVPTETGAMIIRQAQKALNETARIGELVREEKGTVSRKLHMAVSPTIAPFLLPKFIKHYRESNPSVELNIQEMKSDDVIASITQGDTDMGIAISDKARDGVLEIPLYTERFYVYLAESCWRKLPVFKPENLEHETMWIMKEAQCMRRSLFSFCHSAAKGVKIYEAGSIETLIRVVDENGGFTVIPEMQLPFLSAEQRANVRRIEGDYVSERSVSLYIHDDYIRQKTVNSVIDALKCFLPKGMMAEGIARHGIRI